MRNKCLLGLGLVFVISLTSMVGLDIPELIGLAESVTIGPGDEDE